VLAAAELVDSDGHVLGIDFAPQMLDIAREHVESRQLRNVELRVGDMTALELPPQSFDAVVCVLGVFFVDDMPAVTRALWDLLRPAGGRLVVGVLGNQFFDPMLDVFVEAVTRVRPDVHVQQPWRRTEDPDVLRRVFADAAVADIEITSSSDRIPLPSADDWWRIVLGTGLRRTIMSLEPSEAESVRAQCAEYVHEHDVRQVLLTSHLALAKR
jgi:SAM-dependent methyltransferase